MNLLVSDYDGTFYTSEKGIRLNVKAIKKFREQGNIFTIATGRCFNSIKEKITTYNIPYDYLICADGTVMYDSSDLLRHYHLVPVDFFSKCLTVKKRHPVILCFEVTTFEDMLEVTRASDNIVSYNFLVKKGENIKNILDDINIILNTNHQELACFCYSDERMQYISIRIKDVSKSLMIQNLVSSLNIQPCDVFTIGDNLNDYEMIKDYNGYAMHNANSKVIKKSLGVYPSVSNLVNDIMTDKVRRR